MVYLLRKSLCVCGRSPGHVRTEGQERVDQLRDRAHFLGKAPTEDGNVRDAAVGSQQLPFRRDAQADGILCREGDVPAAQQLAEPAERLDGCVRKQLERVLRGFGGKLRRKRKAEAAAQAVPLKNSNDVP